MLTFILKRLGSLIPVSLGVLLIVVGMIHFVPGDPVDIMLGDQASASDKDHLRRELHLDLPLSTQFKDYLIGLTHFDLGRSLSTRTPVAFEIAKHFPATVELTDYAPPGELCGGPCSPTWVTVRGPSCIPGDSGGPVFSGDVAFGIAKGINRTDAGQCEFYYYMSTDYLPPPWRLLTVADVSSRRRNRP